MTLGIFRKDKKLFWISFVFGMFVVSLLEASDWVLFRASGIRGSKFQDLDAVLRSSKNCLAGSELLDASTLLRCADSLNYGPLTAYWAYPFTLLGASAINFGYLIILTTQVLLSAVVYRTSTKADGSFVLKCLLTVNPAVLLMYERGNIDAICFIVLCVATFFFLRCHIVIFVTIVMFLGSIKFYPFVALLLLLVFNKKKTNYVYFAFGFLVICFSLLIGSRNFPSNWYLSFGSQVFLVYFERAFPHLPTVAVGTLLGVISGICIVLTINYLSQNALQHLMRIHVFNFSYENMSFPKQIENPIFTVCCLVHIFSYFAGTNYDYRLIFLTTAILLGEGELSEVLNYTKFLIWGFLTLFVGSAYSAPMGVLPVLQFIGDLSHSVILVVLFFTVFRARDTKERRAAYS